MVAPGGIWATPRKPFTVVIDPGHGGHDAGAPGRYSKEKNINLAVGLKLGDLIKTQNPSVNVMYTRDDDTFIPLHERTAMANSAHADLFISLHCNSAPYSSRNRSTIQGTSVYVAGIAASETARQAARQENAVMTLEADYSTNYQGYDPEMPEESEILFDFDSNQHTLQSLDFAAKAQDHLVRDAGRQNNQVLQAGFWVIRGTTMPSVLVELDFICNPFIEDYLNSQEGQDQLAAALADAFREYKARHDRASGFDQKVPPPSQAKPKDTPQQAVPRPYVSPDKKKRKPQKHKDS